MKNADATPVSPRNRSRYILALVEIQAERAQMQPCSATISFQFFSLKPHEVSGNDSEPSAKCPLAAGERMATVAGKAISSTEICFITRMNPNFALGRI